MQIPLSTKLLLIRAEMFLKTVNGLRMRNVTGNISLPRGVPEKDVLPQPKTTYTGFLPISFFFKEKKVVVNSKCCNVPHP